MENDETRTILIKQEDGSEIQIKKINVQEKDGYVECEGTRKRTTFEARTTEWVNPDTDEGSGNLLTMPKDSEVFGGQD